MVYAVIYLAVTAYSGYAIFALLQSGDSLAGLALVIMLFLQWRIWNDPKHRPWNRRAEP